ncbi:MAG TPA: lmo0937 family membrane protein [Clostridium sp.]
MGLLRWIAGIVIFMWLLGFVLHIGGGLIHILLVIAVVVFIFDLITGKRRM